jgi:hypothetical protein
LFVHGAVAVGGAIHVDRPGFPSGIHPDAVQHLSPAHKDAAIRLLDRRPAEDGLVGDLMETTPPGLKKPSEVE